MAKKGWLALAFLFLLPAPGLGRDLFVMRIEVGGQVEVEGTNFLLQVDELFDEDSLEALFGSAYLPGVSAMNGQLDLRGVSSRISFDANSARMNFRLPGSGIDISFEGGSRDESQAEFEDWLKGRGEQSSVSKQPLTSLLREFVANSPVDPVAGNPNSLESRMFQSDFRLGTEGPLLRDHAEDSERIPTLWKLDFDFGHFAAGPSSHHIG